MRELQRSVLEWYYHYVHLLKIYMTGSCRSWIHYIDLRSAHGTQKEHMEIAEACRKVFTEQFPTVSEALNGNK